MHNYTEHQKTMLIEAVLRWYLCWRLQVVEGLQELMRESPVSLEVTFSLTAACVGVWIRSTDLDAHQHQAVLHHIPVHTALGDVQILVQSNS